MKKINKEIFLGVIIILISLVIFINLFNSYSSNKSNNVSFSLNSDFNNVGSLSVGNDIKIHGVKVGEVANISINPELLVANVIIEFDNFYKIPSDSIFTITSNGLMGGSYIDIKIGSSELIFTENETTKSNIDAISIENIISDIILLIRFNINLFADEELKNANVIILDKSSSTKYYLSLSKNSTFRSLQFEIFSCQLLSFEKYDDQVALIKISNSIDNSKFTGWFFSKTEELNLFSDKIYEISLIDCNN